MKQPFCFALEEDSMGFAEKRKSNFQCTVILQEIRSNLNLLKYIAGADPENLSGGGGGPRLIFGNFIMYRYIQRNLKN